MPLVAKLHAELRNPRPRRHAGSILARAARWRSELAEAIRAFEPRIRGETLKVRTRGSRENSGMPALVFEIEGELWAQPVPLQLFLETKIEVETRLAVVTESQGQPTDGP